MELTMPKKKFYDPINNIVKFNKISHAYLIELDNYDVDYECVKDFIKMIIGSIMFCLAINIFIVPNDRNCYIL